MIDEPGSFYICTETSPRCFIIQKVRAEDLPKVCDELGVLSLDDADCGSSPRRTNEFESKNASAGGSITQRAHGGGGGNTPPPPILPPWWGPECQQKLEACVQPSYAFCTNGEEEVDEYGVTLTYDQQQVASQAAGADGYDAQQGVLQDGGVCDFVVETNVSSSNDFVSPSSTGDQQLRVNVDHYPAAMAYSSVLSSPSDDQPLSMGAVNAAGSQQLEMADDGQGGKWAPSSPGIALELSAEELKTRVRHQLEYYFSRENLAADAYLRSQMDNDQFVKVTTLASFNMVKRLTTDLNLILQALQESPVLQVNETGDKVRPIHKRCTLILREIPEGTTKEEVEELFAGPQCPKIASSEYALNNIWYVNFETDEDAQKAFLYLRQKVQCFKGKPILARIKTAPIPRVQQNGSRPTPPNTLPLQNMPYPAVSPPPNVVVTGSNQLLLSPADSSTFANAATPFSTSSGAGPLSTTPVDNSTVTVDTVMTVPASSPLYYYPAAGHSQSVGPAAAVIGGPPAAVFSSASWPPTNPNAFDLGYILAMNGFQAQGAYRPAVFVPAAPISPACQVGAVPGPRFLGERPPRKPRAGASCYPTHHLHQVDRTGAQSADSGRPPPSYSRYGPASGARSANGNNGCSSGYYADRKGPPYWKYDQNIHYNNIRHRINRCAANGNYAGNGTGMNNFGMPSDVRPRYPPRGGRYGGGYEHWNTGGYQPRPRKPTTTTAATTLTTTATATTTTAASVSQKKKSEEGFDLHSSSFPPLPTVSAEELENEIDMSLEHQPSTENATAASTQQPTQILQREHNDHNTSPVVKVQPRMKQAPSVQTQAVVDKLTSAVASPNQLLATSEIPSKASDMFVKQHSSAPATEQKTESTGTSTMAAQKTTHGIGVARGGGASIPVAVVQPNTQQKPAKVATADKATATDLSPPMARSTAVTEEDCFVSKTVSNDAKSNELLQEKTSEHAKKLSYADMAKHAAVRGHVNASSALPISYSAVPIQKTAAAGASVTIASSGGSEKAGGGKEQSFGRRTDPERGKWLASHDNDLEEDDADGDIPYRRVKNKFGGTLRKHSRSYRSSEGQEQCDGGSQVPSSSC